MGKMRGGKKKQQSIGYGCLGHGNALLQRTMASFFLLLLSLAACTIISMLETSAADALSIDTGVCGQGLPHDYPDQSNRNAPETENAADEENLERLLDEGIAAFQAKDFVQANAIFDRISQEVGTNWSWDQMHLVHNFNGMALIQLGDGMRALWCFKNAMYLADRQSKESRKSPGSQEVLAQFTQQLSRTVMQAGKHFYLAASAAVQNGQANAKLLYTAAQYAHAVGKLEEAKKMLGVLIKVQPMHSGAILELGLIAKSENQNVQALRFLREASRLEQLPHDASPLWIGLAGMECEMDQDSSACGDAWLHSFEAEIKLMPINQDFATQAAVNFCNVKLKTINGGNADDVMAQIVAIGHKATRLGLLNAPLQLPQKLIRGVSFAPYRDDASTWKAVRHLEDNFQAIRNEIVKADAAGHLRQMAALDYEDLHTAGEWRELNVIAHGHVNKNAVDLLPITSGIVFGLQDGISMVLGGSKISLMQPGTVVRPHTGLTNARLRIHLGVSIPPGPRLRVGNETRLWTEGKCTVIDDSYVHEVWHAGTERRIVLIVDVWHPEMDAWQREDSLSNSPHLETYRKISNDPVGELRRQGVRGDLIPSHFVSDMGYLNDSVDKCGAGGREM